ncbi:hypothetical protein LCGC14_2133040 [marine sediment metagenome]|uniref:Polyketide cyclase n=2 Tax=root TaxID=1 RepID=A0A831QQZ1_9FLAO|nr:polyketide cyclase [Pricia antarctica]
METKHEIITIKTKVKADIPLVWELLTTPEHIKKWNRANDDWQTTKATNDLRAGGKFLSRMEAKDGSMGFDFVGTYDKVVAKKGIYYTLDDGRKVEITFTSQGNTTEIIEIFEAENNNPIDMQQAGWQAILDNFKNYVESEQR